MAKAKRKSGGRRRNMRGDGFFGDLWDGVKSVANKVVPFIKDNKLLSKGLSLIPHPYAQTGAKVAGSLGFGRRRRRRGRGAGEEMQGAGGKGSLQMPNAMGSHKRRTIKL